jgi:hypothetical protein
MFVHNLVDYWADFQLYGHCVFDHIRAAWRWLMIIDSATWLTRNVFFIGRLGRRDWINCEFNLISFSTVKSRWSPPVVQVTLGACVRFQRRCYLAVRANIKCILYCFGTHWNTFNARECIVERTVLRLSTFMCVRIAVISFVEAQSQGIRFSA